MIPLLITVAVVTVFVRQFFGPRAVRWQTRARAFVPVGHYFLADVRATRANLSLKRRREAKARARLEAERAKFEDIVLDLES